MRSQTKKGDQKRFFNWTVFLEKFYKIFKNCAEQNEAFFKANHFFSAIFVTIFLFFKSKTTKQIKCAPKIDRNTFFSQLLFHLFFLVKKNVEFFLQIGWQQKLNVVFDFCFLRFSKKIIFFFTIDFTRIFFSGQKLIFWWNYNKSLMMSMMML